MIGLKEAIEALRKELEASLLSSAEQDIQFEVGEIELSMQVVTKRDAGGTGAAKFFVLEVGTDVQLSRETQHTLKIPLTPVSSNGKPIFTNANLTPN